jgi:hypothetical protein
MAKVIISIDESLLRAARLNARRQGTSVSKICRLAIERFAQDAVGVDARLSRLRVLANRARPRGPEALWPGRVDLYDKPQT